MCAAATGWVDATKETVCNRTAGRLHHALCKGIHDLQKEIATMTTTKTPTLNQYWEKLVAGLPPFSPHEQRAAVTLYRELANGQPVDAAQLAQALGASPSEGRTLLARDSIYAFIY